MNNTVIGFISCIISCISFGFMFAPLRNLDCKDGFYVQWIQCTVIFVVGFVINCVRGFPTINPIAMIGGFLFATGNIASVPIVSCLGIGVGMLIWGSVQVIVGWGVARFGLFGTRPQPVYHNLMNVCGLFLVLLSGIMFIFVKHKNQQQRGVCDLSIARVGSVSKQNIEMQKIPAPTPGESSENKLSLQITKTKLGYLGLSVFLGIFHGLMMTPIVYIQDNDPNAYQSVLDYVFAHFSTIFAFSTVYFITYCFLRRSRIYAPSQLILPSVAYGLLWSLGMVLWFVSNHLLSQTVSFPITTRLPSAIGVLADVLLFRTIEGKKNLLFAFLAVAIGVAGIVLIALSNQQL